MKKTQGRFFGVLFYLVTLAFPASAFAKPNVILVMLDGVRWQEVFHGVDPSLDSNDTAPIFPNLFQKFLKEGLIFGDKLKNEPMVVANDMRLSLPAYQSIMAGTTQDCLSNGCGRIVSETFEERLVREMKLDRGEVATIASWNNIRFAVEHEEGGTFVNAAIQNLVDGKPDAETERLNREQAADVPPWSDARFDKYTWAHAMRYLKQHRPRFMFISFDDSDERAHRGEYQEYLKSLRQYDQWIQELIETLNAMGAYGKETTLLITTDHGRGDGSSWTDHGPFQPEAENVWFYGRTPTTIAKGASYSGKAYSHLDIRPTIEAILGLSPQSCDSCGKPMREFLPASLTKR